MRSSPCWRIGNGRGCNESASPRPRRKIELWDFGAWLIIFGFGLNPSFCPDRYIERIQRFWRGCKLLDWISTHRLGEVLSFRGSRLARSGVATPQSFGMKADRFMKLTSARRSPSTNREISGDESGVPGLWRVGRARASHAAWRRHCPA